MIGRVPRRIELIAGGAAGLSAGLMVGAVQLWQGLMAVGLIGTGTTAPGIGFALLFAIVGGIGVGGLLGYRPDGLTAAITAGVLAGLLWWAVEWLTLLPLLEGRRVTWSLREAQADFGFLVGSMIFGGLTALLMQVFLTVWVRARPAAVLADAVPDHVVTRVVVIGGGFAGVSVAQRLEHRMARRGDIDITLVSNSNYLLFTPMLAGVAGGTLHAQDISAPVRAACPQTDCRRGLLEAVDPVRKVITVRQDDDTLHSLSYDHLVLALGAVPNYRGLPGLARHSWPLKTLPDAIRLRDHVIGLLERADVETNPLERRRQLTFVVAGGGFAGAELIAEVCDLVHDTRRYYPRLEPGELRFVLIHAQDRILPELDRPLADYALAKLREKGIEFMLSCVVAEASADQVVLGDGRTVATRTLVWTAGNEPNPLVNRLGFELIRGAIGTDPTLRVSGYDDVWALGDCAAIPDPDTPGGFYPPTAQHALREGKAVADNIVATLRGTALKPFRFRTIALLVALGHQQGAAQIRGHLLEGRLAWFMWRGIYLAKLPGLEKKVRVALGWTLDLFFPRDVVLTQSADVGGRAGGRHADLPMIELSRTARRPT